MTQSRLPQSWIFPRRQPLSRGFLICRRFISRWQAVFFSRQPFLLMISIADYLYIGALLRLWASTNIKASVLTSLPSLGGEKQGLCQQTCISTMHAPTIAGVINYARCCRGSHSEFFHPEPIELPHYIHAHKLGVICGDNRARRPFDLTELRVGWSGLLLALRSR